MNHIKLKGAFTIALEAYLPESHIFNKLKGKSIEYLYHPNKLIVVNF